MSADRVRWEHIQRVYELCNRNVSETARRLNMHRRTLQRILAKRAPLNKAVYVCKRQRTPGDRQAVQPQAAARAKRSIIALRRRGGRRCQGASRRISAPQPSRR